MAAQGRVDLHLHTTVSDGRLSPSALVRLAHANGVVRMSVTDHDATDGIDEAIAEGERLGVEVIPGIELSTDIPGTEVHILGYFLRYQDQAFQETLARFRQARLDRARAMVAKLAEMGMALDWDRVQQLAGEGSVGRPHIAQAMVEAGYVSSIQEAFSLYLGRTGPAYVERFKLTPAEAVHLVRSVGGAAVMAHPGEVSPLQDVLEVLVHAGLAGLECYYNGYAPELVRDLVQLAQRYGLIATGGSDFHGFPMGGATEVTNPPGSVDVPPECVEQLRERAG